MKPAALLLLLHGVNAIAWPYAAARPVRARARTAIAGLLSGDQPEAQKVLLSDAETEALEAALEKYPADAASPWAKKDGWDSFGLTSATSEQWAAVREEFPVLGDRSDEELAGALTTYLSSGPNLVDVLLKTPVGPVFLINIDAVFCSSWPGLRCLSAAFPPVPQYPLFHGLHLVRYALGRRGCLRAGGCSQSRRRLSADGQQGAANCPTATFNVVRASGVRFDLLCAAAAGRRGQSLRLKTTSEADCRTE
eukprot:6204680-Prymnesium_polylepis.2